MTYFLVDPDIKRGKKPVATVASYVDSESGATTPVAAAAAATQGEPEAISTKYQTAANPLATVCLFGGGAHLYVVVLHGHRGETLLDPSSPVCMSQGRS